MPAAMDMLIVLENMAQISTTADTYAGVGRWMRLFGYTKEQAERAIEAHFQDHSRIIISNKLLSFLRDTVEAQGHDQESYAYHLKHFAASSSGQKHSGIMTSSAKRKKSEEYLVRLAGGLTAADIQIIAGLPQPPRVIVNDTGDMSSAVVDTATVTALDNALPPGLIFVKLPGSAVKDLSDVSIKPTLGVDATLPQHRLGSPPLPHQNVYPVPYFFYGTLAGPQRLSMLLELVHEPTIGAATIWRGKKKNWGPYYALVDGMEQDSVQGWVYEVESKEHENELKRYESNNYEVVRCEIYTEGKVVPGLTFRFCGDESELL